MILGIDTDSYGMHVHTDAGRYYSIAMPKKMKDPEERRVLVYAEAKKLFRNILQNDNDVYCEEPLALKNGKTTRTLCLIAGAIWAAHVEVCTTDRIDSRWHWVDVSSWKMRIPGNGNASKEMIRDFCIGSQLFAVECLRTVGMESDHEENLNLYDAWCLLQYGKWHVLDSSPVVL